MVRGRNGPFFPDEVGPGRASFFFLAVWVGGEVVGRWRCRGGGGAFVVAVCAWWWWGGGTRPTNQEVGVTKKRPGPTSSGKKRGPFRPHTIVTSTSPEKKGSTKSDLARKKKARFDPTPSPPRHRQEKKKLRPLLLTTAIAIADCYCYC